MTNINLGNLMMGQSLEVTIRSNIGLHSEGIFLVYTRKGVGSDHVFRHRAPLFMAQVDPKTYV